MGIKLEQQRNELSQQELKLIDQLQSKSHVKPEDRSKLSKRRDEIREKLVEIEMDLKRLMSETNQVDLSQYLVVKRAYPSPATNQHTRNTFSIIDPYTIITNHKRKKRRRD